MISEPEIWFQETFYNFFQRFSIIFDRKCQKSTLKQPQKSNFEFLPKAKNQKWYFFSHFRRLLAITRILSFFKTKTINLEQKWTRKSAGRIWPIIHFALLQCCEVGSLTCKNLAWRPKNGPPSGQTATYRKTKVIQSYLRIWGT